MRYFRLTAIFAATILILTGGAYWYMHKSPKALVLRAISNYESVMRDDAYGGKTPDETISLFSEALRRGDIDSAAKYFMPEQNLSAPDYLTRKKWEQALLRVKSENKLAGIAEAVKKMRSSGRNTGATSTVEYVVPEGDGAAGRAMVLVFNGYAGVWKIESL